MCQQWWTRSLFSWECHKLTCVTIFCTCWQWSHFRSFLVRNTLFVVQGRIFFEKSGFHKTGANHRTGQDTSRTYSIYMSAVAQVRWNSGSNLFQSFSITLIGHQKDDSTIIEVIQLGNQPIKWTRSHSHSFYSRPLMFLLGLSLALFASQMCLMCNKDLLFKQMLHSKGLNGPTKYYMINKPIFWFFERKSHQRIYIFFCGKFRFSLEHKTRIK